MKIVDKIKSFYNLKLSYQQDNKNIEKLSSWAMLFIIILDIFIYNIIQMGINFQTSTLNNPNTKFTYQCRNVIEDASSIKVFDGKFYRNGNYEYDSIADEEVIQKIALKELDSRCAKIQEQINNIKSDQELKNIKTSIKNLENVFSNYSRDLQYIQSNYNTVLFEKMANQHESKSILKMDIKSKNIKVKYDDLQNKISNTKQSIDKLKEQFSANKSVVELYEYVKNNKEAILEDYSTSKNRYFLKRIGVIVLFLLPISVLFYWRMNVQNKKRNYTKYIIYKNIFGISMLFLFINTISLVYRFIPHVFIEKVLLFFYNIQIPFIAYYALLALGIVVFSFIILKIQNANRNKKKTTITFIESYSANKCDQCGIKVDYMRMNYCPNCSNRLKVKCKHCGTYTIEKFENCFNCNEKVDT